VERESMVVGKIIIHSPRDMLHLDSGFFLISQVNTRESYKEGGNISLKRPSSWRRRGKQNEAQV
jgi:hypothetical protein